MLTQGSLHSVKKKVTYLLKAVARYIVMSSMRREECSGFHCHIDRTQTGAQVDDNRSRPILAHIDEQPTSSSSASWARPVELIVRGVYTHASTVGLLCRTRSIRDPTAGPRAWCSNNALFCFPYWFGHRLLSTDGWFKALEPIEMIERNDRLCIEEDRLTRDSSRVAGMRMPVHWMIGLGIVWTPCCS